MFAQDRPSIDAAVKSYISLVCAKMLTATPSDEAAAAEAAGMDASSSSSSTATNDPMPGAPSDTLIGIVPTRPLVPTTGGMSTQQQVLGVGRVILKAVNSFKFPIHHTVATELIKKPGISDQKKKLLLETQVVSQLWNGLVDSKQKPSRFLGRRALQHAWKDMEVSIPSDNGGPADVQQKQAQWLEEFGRLLFVDSATVGDVDDDSALLWDADGGQNELAKRRQRRQTRAAGNQDDGGGGGGSSSSNDHQIVPAS